MKSDPSVVNTLFNRLHRGLRLEYLHHRVGLGLAGVGMLLLVGTIAVAPTIATLTCERKADFYSLCTLRNHSLIGIPVRQVRLEPLTGAQAFPQEETPGWVNRVMLYRSGGRELPFTIFSTDSLTVKRSATKINAFLGNPTIRNFRYSQLIPWPVLLSVLAGALVLLGSGLMLFKIQ
jgi:hypothetical protein